jgi:hypothetical protein
MEITFKTQNCKSQVKLPLNNGESSRNTSLAQFHCAAVFNGWDLRTQAAHFTTNLTGRAADAMFERGDMPTQSVDE